MDKRFLIYKDFQLHSDNQHNFLVTGDNSQRYGGWCVVVVRGGRE